MKIELRSQSMGLVDALRKPILDQQSPDRDFVQRARTRIDVINQKAIMMTEVLGLPPEFKYDVMAGVNTPALLDSQLSMMVDGRLTRLTPEGISALNFQHMRMGRTGGLTE
jgi:hypothetical protein